VIVIVRIDRMPLRSADLGIIVGEMSKLLAAIVFVVACGGGGADPHELADLTDGNTGEVVGHLERGCQIGTVDESMSCTAHSDRTMADYQMCGAPDAQGNHSTLILIVDGESGCCVSPNPAPLADDGLPVEIVWAECL
jgi:hypothetical protein